MGQARQRVERPWRANRGMAARSRRPPCSRWPRSERVRACSTSLPAAGDQTLEIADARRSNRLRPGDRFVAGHSRICAKTTRGAPAMATSRRWSRTEKISTLGEAGFDAAICRLGLMFFPDPGKGLGEMFRALKPGGRACTMVFSAPDRESLRRHSALDRAQACWPAAARPLSARRIAQPRQAGIDRRAVPARRIFAGGKHQGDGAVQAALCGPLPRIHPHLGEPDPADPGAA